MFYTKSSLLRLFPYNYFTQVQILQLNNKFTYLDFGGTILFLSNGLYGPKSIQKYMILIVTMLGVGE